MIVRKLAKIKEQPIFFLVLVFTVLIIYFPALNSYFFQDDWYSFSISQAKSLRQFLDFFLPNKNVVYYRPLGMQIPFFLQQTLFDLNPVPFKILALLTHLLNAFLVYSLFKKLIKSDLDAQLAAFLYATSAIHYIPFYWSATYAFILGLTFTLLSLLFFIGEKYFRAILCFVLGLLTFEIIAVLPAILLAFHLLFKTGKYFRILIPYFLISGLYLIFRFLFQPPPQIPEYRFSLNLNTLLNLKYYFLWIFNWPEEMKNQFVSFFFVNPLFIKDFRFYYYSFIISLSINLSIFILLPLILMLFGKIRIAAGNLIFTAVWTFSAMLPVIFFPLHTFPYYLPLAFLGLLLFLLPLFRRTISCLAEKLILFKWLLPAIIIINWLWSVFVLMDFNAKIHWAPRRSNLSRLYVEKAGKLNIPQGGIAAFIVNPDPENRFALNNQDAFYVLFASPKVQTIYTDKNLPGYRL